MSIPLHNWNITTKHPAVFQDRPRITVIPRDKVPYNTLQYYNIPGFCNDWEPSIHYYYKIYIQVKSCWLNFCQWKNTEIERNFWYLRKSEQMGIHDSTLDILYRIHLEPFVSAWNGLQFSEENSFLSFRRESRETPFHCDKIKIRTSKVLFVVSCSHLKATKIHTSA